MKHFSLLALITLTACAPLETYYKPGASVAAVNRDTTACAVQALEDVPQVMQIIRKPPRFIPGRRVCDADGNCKQKPGYYIDGGVESYDPNVALRQRVERQCMADKGYAPVSIPPCPDRVAKAAPLAATTRLPQLNEGSCVIRNGDGSFQIVTRG
ncbi:hypothetical protein Z945_1956 [Sulfitobacter noctilucae]|uniref:hypothetical protein n=1 Tax=Sulfitobacter noctilucae TaxID=1342302 RepID=UPI000468E422|nr:hypothetical protein [Sulfitobacter noctilucae]KIN60973.1 hypothetical protein Z945_1956 [Sulfitobacter noctilucae]